jgi:putative flippase GtrA
MVTRVIVHPGTTRLWRRFARFSVVGAGGVLVQTVSLAILLRFSGVHYLIATAAAVELSVLHNFFWHRNWTWADRPESRTISLFLRFNLTNGATSLAGNILLMWLLVTGVHLDAHAANLLTIAACSIVNFALADRIVFV